MKIPTALAPLARKALLGTLALGALGTGAVLDGMGYRLPLALSGLAAALLTGAAIFLFPRNPGARPGAA